jgi:hypothetical protein
MKVVNNVLESAELGQDSSMLRVYSIQTQSIDPAFLPQHASQSFAKKADLALAFSSDHPTVVTAIEAVHKANPDMALSQNGHEARPANKSVTISVSQSVKGFLAISQLRF